MVRVLAVAILGWSALAWAQTCTVCGEVRSIRETRDRPAGQAARAQSQVGTSFAADTPPVVGTVAQFSFGGASGGGTGGWRMGAAGTPEMQTEFGATTYEVTGAMDVGEKRTLQLRDGNRFRVGQRVALRGGELEPM